MFSLLQAWLASLNFNDEEGQFSGTLGIIVAIAIIALCVVLIWVNIDISEDK